MAMVADVVMLARREAARTRVLSTVRMRAREEAVTAMRRVERELIEALADDRLRGAPVLTPGRPHRGPELRDGYRKRAERFRGLRVLKQRAHEELGDVEALVIGVDGRLLMARASEDGREAIVRPAKDEDLRAEDLPALLEVVSIALERHAVLVEQRTDALLRIEDLARRITEAREEVDNPDG